MKEIALTRGYVTIVDDDDYDLLVAMGAWRVKPDRCAAYAIKSVREGGHIRTVLMHTVLTGWPRVDHINGDGLDNRRKNLRPATATQNCANSRLSSRNTSGFKCVSWCARSKQWRAAIRVRGVTKYLGLHEDPIQAALAYDRAAIAASGEFAWLNFPPTTSRTS